MIETAPYHKCRRATVQDPAIFCPADCGQISDVTTEYGLLVVKNKETREKIDIVPLFEDTTIDLVCASIIDAQIFAIDRNLTGYRTSAAELLYGAKVGSLNFEKTALRLPPTDLYSLLEF